MVHMEYAEGMITWQKQLFFFKKMSGKKEKPQQAL